MIKKTKIHFVAKTKNEITIIAIDKENFF